MFENSNTNTVKRNIFGKKTRLSFTKLRHMQKMNAIRAKLHRICDRDDSDDDDEEEVDVDDISLINLIVDEESSSDIDLNEEIITPSKRMTKFRITDSSDEENDEAVYTGDGKIKEQFCTLGLIKAWHELDDKGENIDCVRNRLEQFLQLKLECNVTLEKVPKTEFVQRYDSNQSIEIEENESFDISRDCQEDEKIDYHLPIKNDKEINDGDLSDASTVCYNNKKIQRDMSDADSEDTLMEIEDTLKDKDFVEIFEEGRKTKSTLETENSLRDENSVEILEERWNGSLTQTDNTLRDEDFVHVLEERQNGSLTETENTSTDEDSVQILEEPPNNRSFVSFFSR